MSERWEPATYWAALVRGYRDRQEWTQAQLADHLEVDVRAVKHWEAGSRIPGSRVQRILTQSEEKAA